MPIVNNAGNKQMNVHKMQIKEGNHGNLPRVTSPLEPVTLISQWRIKTPRRTAGTSRNQEASGRGQTAGKRVAKQLKANHEGKPAWG